MPTTGGGGGDYWLLAQGHSVSGSKTVLAYTMPPPDLGSQPYVGTVTEGRGTALMPQSLWPDVGGLQAVVIIIPTLLSLSTLLIISCILWKTCCQWSRVSHPSPQSPSGAQVSHSRLKDWKASILFYSQSPCAQQGEKSFIMCVLSKCVTCDP